MTVLLLLLGCIPVGLLARWEIRRDPVRRLGRAFRDAMPAFTQYAAEVQAAVASWGQSVAEAMNQSSVAPGPGGNRLSPRWSMPHGPSLEPGSDAHRVQAIADDELRAWDKFIRGDK